MSQGVEGAWGNMLLVNVLLPQKIVFSYGQYVPV